jgi:hypothetical protein
MPAAPIVIASSIPVGLSCTATSTSLRCCRCSSTIAHEAGLVMMIVRPIRPA